MSRQEIDAYIAASDEPKRGTLETLRRTILEIVPEAEELRGKRSRGSSGGSAVYSRSREVRSSSRHCDRR